MHPLIIEKRTAIAELCRRHHVTQLEVFGSAARGDDFDPATSDADFLVAFAADADSDHDNYFELHRALVKVLDRDVDLVDRKAIEKSRNYIRRRHILEGAETVYVA